MVHSMISLEEEMDSHSPEINYPSTSKSHVNGEGTPHPSKRKRYDHEHDSLNSGMSNTPFRPKSRTGGGVKVNLEGDLEDKNCSGCCTGSEKVLELFRRPHVFPKDSYHELLKGSGVPPKIFFQTATNTAAISKDLKTNPDTIAKRLRKKAKRSSLDKEVEDLNESAQTMSSPEGVKASPISIKSNGTYVINVRGHPIEFAEAVVCLERLRVREEGMKDSLVME